MKKFLGLVALLMSVVVANAQVNIFKGSLKEALVKAKSENKTVMVLCNPSWGGNMVESDFFTEKSVADYINPKFIVIKCIIDKEDPDNIVQTYGNIKVPPTFLFLDVEGNETARMLGSTKYLEDFTKRIDEINAPENSHEARYERFKKDPSYATEYLTYLTKFLFMPTRADEVLSELLEKRPIKENFSSERLTFYEEFIKTPNSPVIEYAIANEKKISKVIGKEKYNDFIVQNAVKFSIKPLLAYTPKQAQMDKDMAEVMSVPTFAQIAFVKFAVESKDYVVKSDFLPVIEIAKRHVTTADRYSREMIINSIVQLTTRRENPQYVDKTNELFEAAISAEKNPETKSVLMQDYNTFKDYAKRFKK